ncbi:PD40 domain-containing protein [Lewinella sp. W8]|uniref:TolB family protein n=1 Tax=Lewinella sp. W8 TaxID=2528208 RepID=UPI0010683742|nr:PD40 domain-containing protein [Lewinella sp. W8]MTB52007.1 hypothetical protein [Lewinella sp. W8]
MFRRLLPLAFLLSISALLPAQDIGLHPPEVDWQQLRSPHVRVIFPEGYEQRAQRVASLIDRLATEHNRSVGEKLYDFDLVLQTPNTRINGYVGLGPFRSEFFVTPPQSFSLLSTADWVDLLTIHEFRHVQQASNERRGITKLFSYLQGQLGWSVFSALATPNWFTEGDAVIAETALTGSGRGRTPAFSETLRAMLRDDIIYSYAKARNGSYRDLVPDHYRYGYAMLTYARERYGNDVWKPILQEGAAYRGLIYPFSNALKRATGFTTPELYDTTMEALAAAQDSALKSRRVLEGVAYAPAPKVNTNYRFPLMDDQGRLLSLRSSFTHIPALVSVDPTTGKESILTTIGFQREPWLDVRDNLALWIENRQNPRFTNEGFSEIIVYELGSGRKRQITKEGRYLSARFSPDRRQIAAVEYLPLEGKPSLVILNTQDGTTLQKYAIQARTIAWPTFAPDGQTVYFFEQTDRGIAIAALDLNSGNKQLLTDYATTAVDMLTVDEAGKLYFTSGRSGVDNIYRLDPTNRQLTQLTRATIGAAYPSVGADGKIYYAEPQSTGMHLRVLAPSVAKAAGEPEADSPGIFTRPKAFSAEEINIVRQLEQGEYPTENFSNTLGGIKLHSWSYNGSYVAPGLRIEATNALNTVDIGAEVLYNLNEERYSGGLQVDYGGLYPVLSAEAIFRDRNFSVLDPATDTIIVRRQEFNQLSFGAGARVPWQWVDGPMFTRLTPSVSYDYLTLNDANLEDLPDNFSSLGVGISFSSLRRIAYQNVQSRLGISLEVAYDRALGDENLGERLRLNSSLFLPGLWPNHGLRLDFGYQREDANLSYQYPDFFRYARGYAAPLNDQVSRFSVNYQLPLLYPDFGIAGITYFKRIRLNAFYDYSRYRIDQYDFTGVESSVGGQLFFDNVWLNSSEITLGVETAYRLDPDIFSADENRWQFRLLFGGFF